MDRRLTDAYAAAERGDQLVAFGREREAVGCLVCVRARFGRS